MGTVTDSRAGGEGAFTLGADEELESFDEQDMIPTPDTMTMRIAPHRFRRFRRCTFNWELSDLLHDLRGLGRSDEVLDIVLEDGAGLHRVAGRLRELRDEAVMGSVAGSECGGGQRNRATEQ